MKEDTLIHWPVGGLAPLPDKLSASRMRALVRPGTSQKECSCSTLVLQSADGRLCIDPHTSLIPR